MFDRNLIFLCWKQNRITKKDAFYQNSMTQRKYIDAQETNSLKAEKLS